MFICTSLITNVLLSSGQDCWSVQLLNSCESTETSIFEHKWHHFNVILFLFVAFYWSWVGIKISSSLLPDPKYSIEPCQSLIKKTQTCVLNITPSQHIHSAYMCTLLWPLLFSNANYIMEVQNKQKSDLHSVSHRTAVQPVYVEVKQHLFSSVRLAKSSPCQIMSSDRRQHKSLMSPRVETLIYVVFSSQNVETKTKTHLLNNWTALALLHIT